MQPRDADPTGDPDLYAMAAEVMADRECARRQRQIALGRIPADQIMGAA
jgi:hypothetical protein